MTIILGAILVFVGFLVGYILCGIMTSGQCQECRLKELKEFENDSN